MNDPKMNLELQEKFTKEILKIADELAISPWDGLETFVTISVSLLHITGIPFAEAKEIVIDIINARMIREASNEESN
jgi:hypothetical protein